MHATYIYDERTYPYCIKPRACCGLVSVAGSFFCHTKQRLVENRVIQNV